MTAAKRGNPRLPPRNFKQRSLQLRELCPACWTRINADMDLSAVTNATRVPIVPRSPLHWSHSPEGRFSHPDNLGVLYLAESAETSFWELFHPNLRDILPRDWRLRDRDLLFRSVWSIDVMAPLWVLDSADGEALRAIGADGSTFTNAYEFTQRWARTLTDHPDGRIQGILYGSVRDPGKRCLALFEGRTRVASLKPKYVARADLHDEVVDVLFRNRIAISPRAAP